MSLLDAGCGPGAITLGLARAVSPGTALGIDIDETSLAAARALAATEGVTNVKFRHGSILELDVEDGAFDVTFAHAVLQHLEHPAVAVRELVRVVRPGGVVALVDADHGLNVLWPESDLVLESNRLIERVRTHAKTSPRIGRELGRLLAENGCDDIFHRARETEPATAMEARMVARGQATLLRDARFRQRVANLPGETLPDFEAMAVAWEEWATMPGATWVRPWFEAMGRKPH